MKMMAGTSAFGKQLEICLQDAHPETEVIPVLLVANARVQIHVKHTIMSAALQAKKTIRVI